MSIHIRRVYDLIENQKEFRVLVDRLWPRGLTKAAARLDLWAKDLAPSSQLRKWFHHEPSKYQRFAQEYLSELKSKQELACSILRQAATNNIALLTATRSRTCTHALILADFLRQLGSRATDAAQTTHDASSATMNLKRNPDR